jgi:hypothetical protein
MNLSILIAIPRRMVNAYWAWIVAELVVLNLIGIYAHVVFKVADQWTRPSSCVWGDSWDSR